MVSERVGRWLWTGRQRGDCVVLETTFTSQVFGTPRWEDTGENPIRLLFEKIRWLAPWHQLLLHPGEQPGPVIHKEFEPSAWIMGISSCPQWISQVSSIYCLPYLLVRPIQSAFLNYDQASLSNPKVFTLASGLQAKPNWSLRIEH